MERISPTMVEPGPEQWKGNYTFLKGREGVKSMRSSTSDRRTQDGKQGGKRGVKESLSLAGRSACEL